MAFRIAGNSDIEIFAITLSNVLDKIDCVGEKWISGIRRSLLAGFVASQCQYILTAGVVGVLNVGLVIYNLQGTVP